MTFPKLFSQISIKKRRINIRKFDTVGYSIKPHFIKIDVEGYDHLVIKGLMNTIKKYKPIILVEYNKENFSEIRRILKDYRAFIYKINDNKLIKIKNSFYNTIVARSNKFNLLSNRNIYFIPNEN